MDLFTASPRDDAAMHQGLAITGDGLADAVEWDQLEPHERDWFAFLALQDVPWEILLDLLARRPDLLESWRLLKRRGRPKGSGARFRDAEDFRQTVVCDLRHLREHGLKDTQQALAELWYERDEDPGAASDSLIAEIKRYCRHYGFSWKNLQAEARQN
jgi:hypothetical protein